jgi:hypothetical protein
VRQVRQHLLPPEEVELVPEGTSGACQRGSWSFYGWAAVNAPGQPPCLSITSSTSAMMRIVSLSPITMRTSCLPGARHAVTQGPHNLRRGDPELLRLTCCSGPSICTPARVEVLYPPLQRGEVPPHLVGCRHRRIDGLRLIMAA